MHLDPETLLVVGTFVGILMSILLAVVDGGMPHRAPGLRVVTASYVIHTASTILYSLQVVAAPRAISVLLANLLFVLGVAVLYAGVRLSLGSGVRMQLLAGLTLLGWAGVAYGTYGVDSMAWRLMACSLVQAPLFTLATVDLVGTRVPARRTGRFIVAGFFSVEVGVTVARAVVILRTGAPGSMVSLRGVFLAYLALHVIAFAGIGIGWILMAHERLREELERQAWHDSLTGAFTRRAFFDLAERERLRCVRTGDEYALLMIDLDHFKMLNDRLGHQAGDLFLTAVAREMQVVLRPNDVLGRYGGEEFIVLLPATAGGQASDVAERLRRTIAGVALSGEPTCGVTASIGVAASVTPGDELDSVLRRADEALYRAKAAGRDRVDPERTPPSPRQA